jgi:hypothetical protein
MTTLRSDGPWRARFLDGPAKEHERIWAIGPVWQRMIVARPGRYHWAIVGGDGMPDRDSEPWESETVYELERLVQSSDDSFGAELIAYYRQVPP